MHRREKRPEFEDLPTSRGKTLDAETTHQDAEQPIEIDPYELDPYEHPTHHDPKVTSALATQEMIVSAIERGEDILSDNPKANRNVPTQRLRPVSPPTSTKAPVRRSRRSRAPLVIGMGVAVVVVAAVGLAFGL